MQTSKEFLRIFLDMGEALLSSGAEIFRVEDTLNRMGYACGATQMNVFVITSSIVITMEFPGEGARTQTRRIRESYGNDFTKLEQLNDLSRRFCNHPIPAAELKKEFDEININKAKQLWKLMGSILGACSFAFLFCFFLWRKFSGCCCSRTWCCFDLGITEISSSSVHE